MEEAKITPLQAGMLLVTLIISTGMLFLPGSDAGRDAWLAVLVGLAIALITALVIAGLGKTFSKQTIMEYTEALLGTYPGKVVSILFIFYFIYLTGLTLRDMGDFVNATLLPQTPLLVVNLVALLVCIYITRSGLEVIARVNQLFLSIILVSLLAMLGLTLSDPEFDPGNLLPFLDSDIKSLLSGSLSTADWLGESLILAMLIPSLTSKESIRGTILAGVSISALVFILIAVFTLAVYGPVAVDFTYPFFNTVKMIHLAKTIERLDLLFAPVWLMGIILKISLLLYVSTLATAQWFNLTGYKYLVIPLSFIIIIVSTIVFQNIIEFFSVMDSISLYFIFMQLVLPLVLLAVMYLRKGN